MYPKKLIALSAALAATAAVVPVAGAQDGTPDAPQPKLELRGAYLYVEELEASGQKLVRVVFRTAKPLPRRGDGAIRAGVAIEGVNHSIGSTRRGNTCYTGASVVRGGSIPVLRDGMAGRKGARIGRAFTVKVFTRDGQSVTRKLKLRSARPGDASGRPLGC